MLRSQIHRLQRVIGPDHWMISLELPIHVVETGTHASHKGTNSKSKRNMDLLKKITTRDSFWDTLELECNEIMTQFQTSEDSSIDEEYVKFRDLLQTALDQALTKGKPTLTTLTTRLKTNQNIVNLRIRKNHLYRIKKLYLNPENKQLLLGEILTVNNKLKKEIDKKERNFLRNK